MGRVLASGVCSYADVACGKMGMRDFFEILRILDWNEYATRKARAMAQAERE